jgi:hypothetical protein
MTIVPFLAIDLTWLPLRYCLWLMCWALAVILFDVARRRRINSSEAIRNRSNIRLLVVLVVYAMTNLSVVAVAPITFGRTGDFLAAMFSSCIPACFAIVATLLFVYENKFDSIYMLLTLNTLAHLTYATHVFCLIYRSAV